IKDDQRRWLRYKSPLTSTFHLIPTPLDSSQPSSMAQPRLVSLAFFVAILISDGIPAGQWRLLFAGCATRLGRPAVGSANFSCITGDCGTGQVACNGAGGAPPTTLVEFTLQGDGGKDFYDVSCVDGFNLPVLVVPSGGSNCNSTSCPVNVNAQCPQELQVTAPDGGVVGCKSACLAFNTDEYCCRGQYDKPDTCKPSDYSKIFKNACPQAYSYAYDDRSSTFT
ncbi:Thaumatin family, partial [Musa troglodytarum]